MAPKKSNDGEKPVVLKMPSLGNPVRLGELYDQKSGLFLGAELYSEESMEVAETDIRHTDLTVSLSTTLEDKASLLDVSAKLSLEVMSGMVSVSGSASYVKDTKSNTNEQAFALALKMRLNEKRILFAEEKMGRNVLKVATEDYLINGLATHFVSAITYGGNIVVNLVARKGKLSTDEQLEGELEAKFNGLKGAISISGSAKVKTQDKFDSLDDKFDLTVYGDVTLDSVPTDPKDVLEIIPQAASFITKGGGVPISVTLQPISEKLLETATKIYEIEAELVDEIFLAFSRLDDLRSRFSVLVDGTKSVEEFVPELARTARATQNQYTKEHGSLLHKLKDFLYDYQHGETDIDFKTVLTEARELYNRHIEVPEEDAKEKYYPATLAALEKELSKFRNFVADLQQLRDSVTSLDKESKAFISLSSIEYITRVIRLQTFIPLFILPPCTPMHPGRQLPDGTSLDLLMIQFLAILRSNTSYFRDTSNPARILYAETLEMLKSRLPSVITDEAEILNEPTFLIGTVDSEGILTWHPPPLGKQVFVKLVHESSSTKRGDVSYALDAVDGTKSFTFQIWAEPANTNGSSNDGVICRVRFTKENAGGDTYLEFDLPLTATITQLSGPRPVKSSTEPDKLFVATFVQNVETLKWTLYLGDQEVGSEKILTPLELLGDSKKVELIYAGSGVDWWNGKVHEVRAFSYALTRAQIGVELAKKAA